MKCPRCGYINNTATRFCQKCGLFFGNPQQKTTQYNRIPNTAYRPVQPVPQQNSIQPVKLQKKGVGAGIIICIFLAISFIFLGAFVVISKVTQGQQTEKQVLTAKQEAENYWKNYCDENYSDIIEVSISHLHDNADHYNNKTILTVAKIDYLNTDSFSTNVQNDNLFFDGAKFDFKQYNDELKYYKEGEIVIVVGNVDSKSASWTDVYVKDCHVIGSGGTASDKAKALNSLDYSYETTAPPTTLSDSDVETKKKNAESQYAKDYSDIDATEIEINRLYDNKDDYIGKTILTAVKIESLNDDNFKVNIQNGSSIFYDVEFRFKEYSDELEYYKKGDFVIVYGTVKDDTSSWSSLCVTDCHIIGSGDEAKKKAQELT